jgi:L-iditol 2-dehydrogenase
MPKTKAKILAARLHGPKDFRIEEIAHPGAPGPGEALIRVTAVGICGSDLHTFTDGRIGDTVVESPMTLGHEFAGVVEAVGADAHDGYGRKLAVRTRVAVDPATACGHCEMCERGDPNLCLNLHFCGTYPDEGCLCEYIKMPARNCFPLPDSIDDETAVMLEPFGIALHTVNLAHIRVGSTVAIIGAGTIGLCVLEAARLAGAAQVFIAEKLDWRIAVAKKLGGTTINVEDEDPVKAVLKATGGRGVDVAIEAAWADESVQQAADMVRRGGWLIVVGIPSEDKMVLKASGVRRRALTIRLIRRMKLTYPRAIELAKRNLIDMKSIISHRVAFKDIVKAYEMNAAYKDRVVKVIVNMNPK